MLIEFTLREPQGDIALLKIIVRLSMKRNKKINTNSMKNKIINIALLTICFLIPVLPLLAQPTPPQDSPIDGGLSLLIAGGVGYGVKKIREKRKPPTPKWE